MGNLENLYILIIKNLWLAEFSDCIYSYLIVFCYSVKGFSQCVVVKIIEHLARTGKILKTKILIHLETIGNNVCTFILHSIDYYKTN